MFFKSLGKYYYFGQFIIVIYSKFGQIMHLFTWKNGGTSFL